MPSRALRRPASQGGDPGSRAPAGTPQGGEQHPPEPPEETPGRRQETHDDGLRTQKGKVTGEAGRPARGVPGGARRRGGGSQRAARALNRAGARWRVGCMMVKRRNALA